MRPPVRDLAGKNVFVTGAASGIGRAVAHRVAGGVPHAGPPPPAVLGMAALRGKADAGRAALAPGVRAGDPARRDRPRLGLRADPAPAARPSGWAHRREIARVEAGGLDGWADPERTLLAAADELLATDDLSDETWTALRASYDERAAIEIVMLVGHYRMLATALHTLRVAPDRPRR